MSSSAGMPYRVLGRTGEQVSLVGLGGFHLGRPTEQEAITIVRFAPDGALDSTHYNPQWLA